MREPIAMPNPDNFSNGGGNYFLPGLAYAIQDYYQVTSVDTVKNTFIEHSVEHNYRYNEQQKFKSEYFSDYPFMHLLYSQLLVCQRVCLQNTVCLICK